MAKTGVNDPCPCGSGKKYKKCHALEESRVAGPMREAASLHAMDERLVGDILRFALGQLGGEWCPAEAFEGLGGDPSLLPFFVPWSVYVYALDGVTAAERYRVARSARLSPVERSWLEAQARAWMSAWECETVTPGEGMRVRDLLSGVVHDVIERRASQSLRARDTVLGRVVVHDDVAVFCGMHPRSLPPRAAMGVAESARKVTRVRTKLIAPARMLDEELAAILLYAWGVAVEMLDRRPLPTLQNTDGDPLLLTRDHFVVAKGASAEVARRVAALQGAEETTDEGEQERSFALCKPGNAMHESWEHTTVAHVRLSGSKLVLETNSVRRADAARGVVEAACGELVRHRAREHEDPSAGVSDDSGEPAPREAPPPEAIAMLMEMKRAHYAGWADSPIPALDGLTPREAMKDRRSRAELELLLKEMENHEANVPPNERYDFGELRATLGLDAKARPAAKRRAPRKRD